MSARAVSCPVGHTVKPLVERLESQAQAAGPGPLADLLRDAAVNLKGLVEATREYALLRQQMGQQLPGWGSKANLARKGVRS